jgi:S1-C subfamily serine protease
MKKLSILAILLATTTFASAADATSSLLKGVYQKYATSLAVARIEIKSETGTNSQTGVAVCIHKSGLFLVSGLNGRFKPENITKCELVLPGQTRKTVAARFDGFDPLTGLGFVVATKRGTFVPVAFQTKSGIAIGDKVVSLGLCPSDPAMLPTLGVAYVASIHRTPNLQIRVTGGTLTSAGSLVFNANGQMIGLVLNQPWTPHLAPNRKGGTASMMLQNQESPLTFTPVEEFVSILSNRPKGMRRMPWIAVGSYAVTHKDFAEAKGLKTPAIKVDDVITGGPADKAGIRDGDMITALNGKALPTFANNAMVTRWFVQQIGRTGGKEISLGILSTSGKKYTTKLRPVAIPKLPTEADRFYSKELGLLAREKVDLDRFLDKSPTASVAGLLVLAVGRGTPCAIAGLRVDDVIAGANNRPISTVTQMKAAVDKAKKTKAPIRLIIKRGTDTEVITVRFPQQ